MALAFGRGRPLHQKMFLSSSYYYSPAHPSRTAPGLATSYFFSPAFTGSQALEMWLPQPTAVSGANQIYAAQSSTYYYVPCIPGQQYTTSVYWRQSGGSTPLRLSITGGVLNTNPYFPNRSGITDWAGTNTTLVWQAGTFNGKTGSMLITPAGSIATVDAYTPRLAPISTPDMLTASIWVYSPNGWSDVRVGINQYDSSGSLIVQSFSATATAVPAATWTRITDYFTPRVNAASVQLRIRIGGTPSSTDVLNVSEATLTPTMGYINGSFSDARYTWVRQSITFTATSTQHTLTLGTPPFVNGDPTFEYSLGGWTPTQCYIALTPVYSHSGSQSMQVTPNGSANQVASDLIPIPYGATDWTLSAWVFSPNGYSDIRVSLTFYDNTQSIIANVQPSTANAIPAATWTQVTYAASGSWPTRRVTGLTGVPAYVSLRVTQGGTPATTDVFYVDDVYLAFVPSNVQSNVFIDALQHELGSSTSAWSSTGPSIYGLFGGFVERWPANWNYQGTYGLAQLTGVDALSIMSNRTLHTEFVNQLLALQPAYYWRLNEAQGATQFAETSGNAGPPLSMIHTKYGSSTTQTVGTATNIVGDPSGTGVTFAGASGNNNNSTAAVTVLSVGTAGTPPLSVGPNNSGQAGPASWGLTVAFWLTTTDSTGGQSITIRDYTFDNNFGVLFTVNPQVSFTTTINGNPFSIQATASGVNYADGKPHFWVARFLVTGNVAYVDLYVDYVAIALASGTASVVLGTSAPNVDLSVVQVGGQVDQYGNIYGIQGTWSHVAIWNREISVPEIGFMMGAARGWTTDVSGTRVSRYLNYNYIARSSVEVAQGSYYSDSIMAASTLAEGTALLDACQGVTLSENGNFFVDPTGGGIVTFQNRFHRYAETTAKWVFGENTAAGEIPYSADIAFDFDPTQVYNDVRVERSGGVNAAGGSQADIAASQLAYGTRSYSRTINIASDNEAQNAADWLFMGHKDPHQRLQQLTINPTANPNIWPAALGIRISDRVTVNRRTSAGFVMSEDFFIERIEHQRAKDGTWLVTYQMSPFAATAQPGFFDNPTYGRFDTGGSQLQVAISATDTALVVGITNNTANVISETDVWSTSSSDTPFAITVGSEEMVATRITDSLLDTFNRTVSNNWGTPDAGPTWTVSSAPQFAVTPGTAVINAAAASTEYSATVTGFVSGNIDVTVYGWVASQVPAGGGSYIYGIRGRLVDANNYVEAQMTVPAGTPTVTVRQIVGGVVNSLTSVSVTGATATTPVNVRFQAIGSVLQMKVWLNTVPEPTTWLASMTTTFLSSGGLQFYVQTGSVTNTFPITYTFNNITMQNPQTFTVTRATGSAAHAIGAPVNVTNAFRLAY